MPDPSKGCHPDRSAEREVEGPPHFARTTSMLSGKGSIPTRISKCGGFSTGQKSRPAPVEMTPLPKTHTR